MARGHGIRLASGQELPADIIVTATGLKLLALGGVALTVDGVPVEPGQALTYKGVMLGNVPNLALCVGYTNASWTLRADLSSRYVCRLLDHMTRHDGSLAGAQPLLSLKSGYVQRAEGQLPRQGAGGPVGAAAELPHRSPGAVLRRGGRVFSR